MKFKLMEISTEVRHEVKVGMKETLVDSDGFSLIGKVTLLR